MWFSMAVFSQNCLCIRRLTSTVGFTSYFVSSQLLQYKQRCKELELEREAPSTSSYLGPLPSTPLPSALDAAQAHLREMREERIQDLNTALRRLDDERRE